MNIVRIKKKIGSGKIMHPYVLRHLQALLSYPAMQTVLLIQMSMKESKEILLLMVTLLMNIILY